MIFHSTISTMRSLILLSTLFAFAFAHYSTPPTRDGLPIIPCATEDIFAYKMQVGANNCTKRGVCDDAAYRDAVGSTNTIITINTALHIMNNAAGKGPDGWMNLSLHSIITNCFII